MEKFYNFSQFKGFHMMENAHSFLRASENIFISSDSLCVIEKTPYEWVCRVYASPVRFRFDGFSISLSADEKPCHEMKSPTLEMCEQWYANWSQKLYGKNATSPDKKISNPWMQMAFEIAAMSPPVMPAEGAVAVKDGLLLCAACLAAPAANSIELEKDFFISACSMLPVNAAKTGVSLKGCTVYSTQSPTPESVKILAAHGTAMIVYSRKGRDFERAEKMASAWNVKLEEDNEC